MCYHKFTLSFGKEGVGLCYKFGKIIIRSMDGVYSENIIFTSVGRAAHREKIIYSNCEILNPPSPQDRSNERNPFLLLELTLCLFWYPVTWPVFRGENRTTKTGKFWASGIGGLNLIKCVSEEQNIKLSIRSSNSF